MLMVDMELRTPELLEESINDQALQGISYGILRNYLSQDLF